MQIKSGYAEKTKKYSYQSILIIRVKFMVKVIPIHSFFSTCGALFPKDFFILND